MEISLEPSSFTRQVYATSDALCRLDEEALLQQEPAVLVEVHRISRSLRMLVCDRVVVEDWPAWLTAERHLALLRESSTAGERVQREPRAPVYATTGQALRDLMLDPTLYVWAASHFGRGCLQPPSATYISYATPRQRCQLHVDNPETHGLNLLIGLQHSSSSASRRSILRLLLPTGIRDIEVRPGRVLMFHACCVPHLRTPLDDGEVLHLASIGFPWSPEMGTSPIRASVRTVDAMATGDHA
jgi:hypothetical protein